MKEQKIVVYSASSEVKAPGKLFRSMFRDLWRSRSLSMSLMKRDISASYRQSFFGFLWAFIPPILTAVTFTFASRNKILNLGVTEIPYPAFVLISVTLWQTFSESVLGPVSGLTAARSFITKINFPREALFLAKFGQAIFNFGVKMVLIIAVFIYYGITPTLGVFPALLIILCLLILGQGIGLILAPINMIYQDIGKALPLLLSLGMFITPVVYPIPKNPKVAAVVMANPVTYLISGIRDMAIDGYTIYWTEIIIVFICSITLFFVSWIVFRLSMPYVIEQCP